MRQSTPAFTTSSSAADDEDGLLLWLRWPLASQVGQFGLVLCMESHSVTLDRFFVAFVLIASQWIRQACSNVHEKKLARKVIGFSLQKADCYDLTVSILGVLAAAKSGLVVIASVAKQRKMTASAKKIYQNH